MAPSSSNNRFAERFSAVVRVGAKTYFADFYFHMLRMSGLQTALFWFMWWLLSGIILGAMFWGGISTLEDNKLFRPGLEGPTDIHSFTGCLYFGCAIMADAEEPYVEGAAVETVMLIAGLWRTISMALFIATLLEKIANPRARIRFAKQALLTSIDGKPSLTFRFANEKSGWLMDAEVKVFVMQAYVTAEGWHGVRPVELKLMRAHMPILSLSWNVVHQITPDSPLAGYAGLVPSAAAAAELDQGRANNGVSGSASTPLLTRSGSLTSSQPSATAADLNELELLIFFKGEDPVQRETIRAHHAYAGPGEILVTAARYADVIHLPATSSSPSFRNRSSKGTGSAAAAGGVDKESDAASSSSSSGIHPLSALRGRLCGGAGRSVEVLRQHYGARPVILDLHSLDKIEGAPAVVTGGAATMEGVPAV